MPSAEIFSGYEIWVTTHKQQKKFISIKSINTLLKKLSNTTKSTNLKVVKYGTVDGSVNL